MDKVITCHTLLKTKRADLETRRSVHLYIGHQDVTPYTKASRSNKSKTSALVGDLTLEERSIIYFSSVLGKH